MLKRKLIETGLAGNAFLLLIAVVSVAATHQIGNFSQGPKSDTTAQLLIFDTILLKIKGTSVADDLDAPVIGMNKHAIEYVNSYTIKNNELLEKIREKSGAYFKITDAIFNKYGLPEELKYLAVVESQLKTNALSRVGARGAWQLMPKTARIFSLKITRKYDERTHFYKSTEAAAKYLRDLHKIFDDWLLVIAAYNSGPGRVYEAIKKSGSRNFWKLQNFLPAETRTHVKKFISTHYYFEGQGSVATITQEEVNDYKKIMTAFVEKQNMIIKEQQIIISNSNLEANTRNDKKIAGSGIEGELKLNNENEK